MYATNFRQLLKERLDNPAGFVIIPPSRPYITDFTGKKDWPTPKKHHVSVVRALYEIEKQRDPYTSTSGKVAAIKFMRSEYGLGLKEAKDFCDWIASYHDGDPDDPLAILWKE